MTVAVSAAEAEGAETVVCASTGNTAASAAAYAARGGMRGAVIVPEGKIATGKLAQALMHGARVIALRGDFDEALALVRDLASRHPISLVNSVNDYRIEGQKTAAFEVCDDLGEAPDVLCIPVGNAGNITSWWKGFQEYEQAPRLHGYQAEGAAPLVLGAPVEEPETVASAIRIGNPARWEDAMSALTSSRGEVRAVSDAEILDAYSLLGAREGVFCEPASAASVAGLLKYGAEGRCGLRAHRARPEGPSDRHEPRRIGGAVRAGHRERGAGGAGLRRRNRRRSCAFPPPRRTWAGVRRAGGGAWDGARAGGRGDRRVRGRVRRAGRSARAKTSASAPSSACTRPTASRFRIRSEIPAAAGLGSSAAAIVAGLVRRRPHVRARRAAVRARRRARGPSRQRRGGAARGLCHLRGHRGAGALRPAGGPGGRRRDPRGRRWRRARRARRCRPRCRSPTRCTTWARASLLVLGLARDDFSLIGRGLRDRLHQPRRRALYPQSMELVERAAELGAVGATISGAGPTVLFWCHWQQTGGAGGAAARRGRRMRGAPRDVLAGRGGRARALRLF